MLYRHTTRPNTHSHRGLVVVISGGLLLVLFCPLVVGFVVSSSHVVPWCSVLGQSLLRVVRVTVVDEPRFGRPNSTRTP